MPMPCGKQLKEQRGVTPTKDVFEEGMMPLHDFENVTLNGKFRNSADKLLIRHFNFLNGLANVLVFFLVVPMTEMI